jgi:hypothetical protein
MNDRGIHVEHVIPRSYRTNEDWINSIENTGDIDRWMNTGANLTLLSGKKNIQASNNGFHSKIQSYRGKGFYSEHSEGVTSFRITQKIVNDFDKETYGQEWNLMSMTDRWNWFCNEIEAILEIDLSGIKIS